MIGRRESLVVIIGALLLAYASATAFAQAPTAKAQQPPSVSKLISPFKGEAEIQNLPARASREGNMVVTKFKVKNMAKGPLAGFRAFEFWYNAKGETVSASPQFRVPKPMMPGEEVEVVLKSPQKDDMSRKITQFEHANGKIKVKQVTKFSS